MAAIVFGLRQYLVCESPAGSGGPAAGRRGSARRRRNISPQIGQLALPGGYITRGESWQQAGARELYEETGIIIQPEDLREFRVKSAPGYNTLVVFGLAQSMRQPDLPPLWRRAAAKAGRISKRLFKRAVAAAKP